MDDDTPTKKGTKPAVPDLSDLPPIHDIPAIFSDIVSRIPDIKQVADHVSGRKLRVATMCSGTESPLLALELIQKSLPEEYGVNFEIKHVFSCEIEPFRQAYIERNYYPPILFRDVCELGNAEAHTAYGALEPVPGDVDLLVAGTSCVDYFNLNNEKQDIDANSESGRTFRGMMSWVTIHKPPIVILEGDKTTREVATVYKTVSGKVKEVDVLTMKDKDRDVDERKKPAREPKKRKVVDGGERTAKKWRHVENDPWKLESKSVLEDWRPMRSPPLEIFHFARKTVDEYTYLDGKVHSLVTNLTAEQHWVLSGTPPIHDFAALKTIAAFLNILGVDDDGEACLDKFVRQNTTEIDEIPWTDKVVDITLPAAERAIYLELKHHLRALDMTIKRSKKTESNREKRLAKSLGESKSAEEALLKRCSRFDLENSNENAMKACDVIVGERQKQLDECKVEFLKSVKDGVRREMELSNVGDESMFQEWIRVPGNQGVGDKEATDVVIKLLDEKLDAQDSEHRDKTHETRRIMKELIGRIRSLRYFRVVRDLQKQRTEPLIEECIYAASGVGKSAARALNVVKADALGVDDEARDGQGKHFGMKLEKVFTLIKHLTLVQFPDLMKKVIEAFAYNKIKFLEIKVTAHQKSKNLETYQNESEEHMLLLNVMDESASWANLTSANHAIFLSPSLAPSKEIYKACKTQAVGWLVRYGQEKHVYVWRFLTKNTVDEGIYNQHRDVQLTISRRLYTLFSYNRLILYVIIQ
ncbi:hypothetical protein ARMGADRAFT_1080997 [Armillaria gallica]|uniref:Uncharacterized protein n=1 Tax=Armillaria gallica TaxID=47427 RepID=A0A2H3DSZ4_ARMGA|nr:hypothetical protein ARMGADRAFT_1080997 [Armillaria gallica]